MLKDYGIMITENGQLKLYKACWTEDEAIKIVLEDPELKRSTITNVYIINLNIENKNPHKIKEK